MDDLKQKIINEIKKVYDPEIPVNIYELGLIYKIDIDKKNNVKVDMTLTFRAWVLKDIFYLSPNQAI